MFYNTLYTAVRLLDNAYIRFLLGSRESKSVPFRRLANNHLERTKGTVSKFDLIIEVHNLTTAGPAIQRVVGPSFNFDEISFSNSHSTHKKRKKTLNSSSLLHELFENQNRLDRGLFEHVQTLL